MYARVAKWEGGNPEEIRESARRIDADSQAGPPEGLPAKGLLMLVDPDNGSCMAISLFASEEDLRTGDAKLNTMSPPVDMGTRTTVETYELLLDVRAPS